MQIFTSANFEGANLTGAWILYADLQEKNVRCWFAPEDMKIGDRIRPRIDEAVRRHDTLVLVLSDNSTHSP